MRHPRPAPCACASGQTQVVDNCYAASGGVENNATALKRGFKNARALKNWHGRCGWLSHDQGGCNDRVDAWNLLPIAWESYQGSSDPFHYLTLDLSASHAVAWTDYNTSTNNYSASITALRQFTVDRYSGHITATGSNNPGSGTGAYPLSAPDLTATIESLLASHEDANGCAYLIALFSKAVNDNINNWPSDASTEVGILTGAGQSWTLTRYRYFLPNPGDPPGTRTWPSKPRLIWLRAHTRNGNGMRVPDHGSMTRPAGGIGASPVFRPATKNAALAERAGPFGRILLTPTVTPMAAIVIPTLAPAHLDVGRALQRLRPARRRGKPACAVEFARRSRHALAHGCQRLIRSIGPP